MSTRGTPGMGYLSFLEEYLEIQRNLDLFTGLCPKSQPSLALMTIRRSLHPYT